MRELSRGCADIHGFPHEENLSSANCGNCHDEIQVEVVTSVHGEGLFKKGPIVTAASLRGLRRLLLLVGVFTIFGLHATLRLPCSFK